MISFNVKYEAAIKNKKEQDYCQAVIDALKSSNTTANQVTFARKTKSYGSTGVAMYRATRSRDNKVKEIWVNLGKISNTATLTKNPKCDFNPDFSTISNIVDYAESPRITAWFNK